MSFADPPNPQRNPSINAMYNEGVDERHLGIVGIGGGNSPNKKKFSYSLKHHQINLQFENMCLCEIAI